MILFPRQARRKAQSEVSLYSRQPQSARAVRGPRGDCSELKTRSASSCV